MLKVKFKLIISEMEINEEIISEEMKEELM
jgi:hypothetical protein